MIKEIVIYTMNRFIQKPWEQIIRLQYNTIKTIQSHETHCALSILYSSKINYCRNLQEMKFSVAFVGNDSMNINW